MPTMSRYVPLEANSQQTLSPSSTMPLISPLPTTSRPANSFRKLRLYLRTLARFRHRDKEKIAFLIGIGYMQGGKYELRGSHKDIQLLEDLLRNCFNYTKFIILSDKEGTPTELLPTYDNIMRELTNCMSDNPNADFFFAYSGHSSHRNDYTGEEEDGQEEFLIPSDAGPVGEPNHEKIITDKTLRSLLVNRLPKNSRLTALFDTCHSGTLLNLEHQRCNHIGGWRGFVQNGLRKAITEPLSHQKTRVKQRVNLSRNLSRLLSIATKKGANRGKDSKPRESKRTRCNGFCPRVRGRRCQVISISACDDSQQCVEDPEGGTMTTAIVTLLKENRLPTYEQVMEAARNAVYEAQKVRKAKMDDFINKRRCDDLTCSFRRHERCLAKFKTNLAMCRMRSDPKLSSLMPLHTNDFLKL